MDTRVAVVTGGTRGIGRAISLALGHANYRVYAIYARNQQAAESLAEEARGSQADVRCIRGNLTDEDHFQTCVEQIKNETERVDVIVHSAASGVHREAISTTPKHLRWTFDVNVLTIHKLMLELVPMMPSGGRIVGITSHGATHVLPFYAAVGTSKGALEALFRHYAVEFAPRGISVNLLCPGLVLTGALDAFPDKEQRIEKAVARTPTGRLTTPEDVAATVLFMCSLGSAQIIGQTIVIDGGGSLN